jgi:SIR2-like domain
MNGGQSSHDAQKTLSDLRDHLARHDKPIAFFFGAGTSCSVAVPAGGGGEFRPLIPAVPGLTAACKKDGVDLGEKYLKAWASIEAQCVEAKQDPHVENILSRVRMMLNAIGKDDTLSGLKTDELKKLEECMRSTIARLVTPDLKGLPADYPHRRFARWLSKTSRKACIEIFTVNYDVLVEHALESERVPVFDGFVGSYQPFFHPDSLRRTETAPGANWTRLWKMHGSVTWRRIEQDGRFRVVRGEPDPAGEMILPSFQKYDESRQQPFASFTERLNRFLEQDDALLIVAGFSFGDEHINNLIFGALENRPRTHVYALQF